MRREVNRNSARKNDTMTHRYHAPQSYRVKAYKNTRAVCFRIFLLFSTWYIDVFLFKLKV